MVHQTLEEHVKKVCANDSCRKPRNGEPLNSHFDLNKHYISWKCEDCGHKNWWETEQMSSGIHHMLL